jgi:outer membrane protein insertion porin family
VVDLSYRLESVNVGDLGFITSPSDAWDVKGSNLISALTIGFARDRRNDPYLPTRGYLARASVELAGLGGDHDYIKWDVETKWYHLLMESPKGPHVLNLRGRLGVAHGDVPLFERFYAGGAESLRGFAYREAGPHDGRDPIGGDFLLVGSAEYEFPLVRTRRVEVRGAVFSDFGWVNRSVRLTDPRLSVGAGLRFNFPGLKTLPVAVDFAWPAVRESGDETEIVNIRVGLSF